MCCKFQNEDLVRTITFGDYQQVDGIYFPFARKYVTVKNQKEIVGRLENKILSLKWNPGLNQELFNPDFQLGETIDHVELKNQAEVQAAIEKHRVDVDSIE